MKPLIEFNNSGEQARKALPIQVIKAIFRNIETIYNIHVHLLQDLEDRKNSWPFVTDMPEILLKATGGFAIYGKYVEEAASAQETLDFFKEKPPLNSFLTKMYNERLLHSANLLSKSKIPDLQELLELPFKHLFKLFNSFFGYLYSTPSNDPDYELLADSIVILSQLKKFIWNKAEEGISIRNMKLLQKIKLETESNLVTRKVSPRMINLVPKSTITMSSCKNISITTSLSSTSSNISNTSSSLSKRSSGSSILSGSKSKSKPNSSAGNLSTFVQQLQNSSPTSSNPISNSIPSLSHTNSNLNLGEQRNAFKKTKKNLASSSAGIISLTGSSGSLSTSSLSTKSSLPIKQVTSSNSKPLQQHQSSLSNSTKLELGKQLSSSQQKIQGKGEGKGRKGKNNFEIYSADRKLIRSGILLLNHTIKRQVYLFNDICLLVETIVPNRSSKLEFIFELKSSRIHSKSFSVANNTQTFHIEYINTMKKKRSKSALKLSKEQTDATNTATSTTPSASPNNSTSPTLSKHQSTTASSVNNQSSPPNPNTSSTGNGNNNIVTFIFTEYLDQDNNNELSWMQLFEELIFISNNKIFGVPLEAVLNNYNQQSPMQSPMSSPRDANNNLLATSPQGNALIIPNSGNNNNNNKQQTIPEVVRRIIEYLTMHITNPELFQCSMNVKSIELLREPLVYNKLNNSNLHDIAGLLILYLDQLPDILLLFENVDLIFTAQRIPDEYYLMKWIQEHVSQLSTPCKNLLDYLMNFLSNLLAHSSSNNLTSIYLAVIFSPLIVKPRILTMEYCFKMARVLRLVKLMIERSSDLFNYDPSQFESHSFFLENAQQQQQIIESNRDQQAASRKKVKQFKSRRSRSLATDESSSIKKTSNTPLVEQLHSKVMKTNSLEANKQSSPKGEETKEETKKEASKAGKESENTKAEKGGAGKMEKITKKSKTEEVKATSKFIEEMKKNKEGKGSSGAGGSRGISGSTGSILRGVRGNPRKAGTVIEAKKSKSRIISKSFYEKEENKDAGNEDESEDSDEYESKKGDKVEDTERGRENTLSSRRKKLKKKSKSYTNAEMIANLNKLKAEEEAELAAMKAEKEKERERKKANRSNSNNNEEKEKGKKEKSNLEGGSKGSGEGSKGSREGSIKALKSTSLEERYRLPASAEEFLLSDQFGQWWKDFRSKRAEIIDYILNEQIIGRLLEYIRNLPSIEVENIVIQSEKDKSSQEGSKEGGKTRTGMSKHQLQKENQKIEEIKLKIQVASLSYSILIHETIVESILNDQKYLHLIYSSFNGQLNNEKTNKYFCDLLEILIHKSPEAIFHFQEENNETYEKLIQSFGSGNFCNLILTMSENWDHENIYYHRIIVQWSLTSLKYILFTPDSPESDCLSNMIRFIRFLLRCPPFLQSSESIPFINQLNNQQFIEKFIDISLFSDNQNTCVTMIPLLIELLLLNKYKSSFHSLSNTSSSSQSNKSGSSSSLPSSSSSSGGAVKMEQLKSEVPFIYLRILEYHEKILKNLEEPLIAHKGGKPLAPFGFYRFHLVKILQAIFIGNYSWVNYFMVKNELISICLELFFKYYKHSILQSVVIYIIRYILAFGNKDLIELIVITLKLPDKIIELFQDEKYSEVLDAMRGNLKTLILSIRSSPIADLFISDNLIWKKLVVEVLREEKQLKADAIAAKKGMTTNLIPGQFTDRVEDKIAQQ